MTTVDDLLEATKKLVEKKTAETSAPAPAPALAPAGGSEDFKRTLKEILDRVPDDESPHHPGDSAQ